MDYFVIATYIKLVYDVVHIYCIHTDFLLALPITDRQVLNSPTIIVNLSIFLLSYMFLLHVT